jgi:hypothetical protein
VRSRCRRIAALRTAGKYRRLVAVRPDSAGGTGADHPRNATGTEGAAMKISLISIAIAGVICAGAFGTGRALATTSHHATKTVKIVMHDPGCHWFMVHGKMTKTDTVKANRVRLVNLDEDALKVTSRHGVKHVAVGKSIVVGHGHYVIMMVGQAPDDNYLKLTVR